MNREEKLKAREIELLEALESLKRELIERAKPISEELMCLRESRGPQPFLVDGRTYVYTGPLPPYLLPEEK